MNTQKPDAVELLPCPFCGGKVEIRYCEEGCCGAKPREVLCINRECGLEGFSVSADTDEQAIEQWNTRDTAERDALKAEVGEGKVRSGQPYWWCPQCQIEVDGKQVTYWERHEMCGGEVEIKTEPYTEAKGGSR